MLFRRKKIDRKRILIEDSLKHIYEFETNNLSVSFQSFMGALKIKEKTAIDLILTLTKMQLIEKIGNSYKLTAEGTEYAIRIIRIHRLLEKYLAEETGISEKDWHRIAEDREHQISEAEALSLAAHLGNPLRDPHGDPIPSSSGDIRKISTETLDKQEINHSFEIVHIEDEPSEIYSEIISLGISAGTKLKLIDKQKNNIIIFFEGKSKTLSHFQSTLISVKEISNDILFNEDLIPLSVLKIGEQAIVKEISQSCKGRQRRRLMDFGIVPGSIIVAELTSLSGNPRAYRIRGTTIALRTQQSELIYVLKN